MPVKVCFGYWEIQIVQAVAQHARLRRSRTMAAAPSPTSIAGIRYAADNGAKVINLSLGGPGQSIGRAREPSAMPSSKGAFVAMSGGNSFDEGNPVEYPAGFAPQIDGAMSVAATADRDAARTTRAPAATSRLPHREVTSETAVCRASSIRRGCSRPTATRRSCGCRGSIGTSISRCRGRRWLRRMWPVLPALLYAQGITNPAAIEAAIKRFAVDLGAPGRDDEFGYGLIDARARPERPGSGAMIGRRAVSRPVCWRWWRWPRRDAQSSLGALAATSPSVGRFCGG